MEVYGLLWAMSHEKNTGDANSAHPVSLLIDLRFKNRTVLLLKKPSVKSPTVKRLPSRH